MTELVALGVNHQTAPLALRERVSFGPERVRPALQDLIDRELAKEAAIVSTCNRTEVYCATEDSGKVLRWLADFQNIDAAHLEKYVYALPEKAAVSHAFRVASGLESMVIGEPQILGQIKEAVRTAEQAGSLGSVLHKLFQRSFSVAKEVRFRTEIGASSVSMAAAAVRVAERIFPSVSEQAILFVGAGEMIDLCATHFAGRKPKSVAFVNRTSERAGELAQKFGGQSFSLSDVPEVIARFDVLITCTASPLPLIGKGLVERALKVRRHKPILIVDLAVPRDVEAEVGRLRDVFLYSIDDLGKIVKEGMELRQSAVSEAETIIARGVSDFMQWMSARDGVPAIRAFRSQAEAVREYELDRAFRALARGEDASAVLRSLASALTNKFLHGPTHALHTAHPEQRKDLVEMLERLYFTDRKS